MKKDDFIRKMIEYPKEKWTPLENITGIILKNNRMIPSNWQTTRFLITDNEILIKYGKPKKFGAELSRNVLYRIGEKKMNFPGNIERNPADFRELRVGDLIAEITHGKIVGTALVEEIIHYSNMNQVTISNPFYFEDGYFAYYDGLEKREDSLFGIPTATTFENIDEISGKTHKKFGIYQEKIKIRDIKEIF